MEITHLTIHITGIDLRIISCLRDAARRAILSDNQVHTLRVEHTQLKKTCSVHLSLRNIDGFEINPYDQILPKNSPKEHLVEAIRYAKNYLIGFSSEISTQLTKMNPNWTIGNLIVIPELAWIEFPEENRVVIFHDSEPTSIERLRYEKLFCDLHPEYQRTQSHKAINDTAI